MPKRLQIASMVLGLCLLVGSQAAAQDNSCESDTDCAEGERCQSGLVVCASPPCEGGGEMQAGNCVDAMLGEPCTIDADCGGELTCAHLVVTDCPEDSEDCTPQPAEEEGFCADNATLAASSGLAPEPPVATAGDGTSGGMPETMESSAPPSAGNSNSGGGDSSSCMVGGQGGGMAGLLPLAISLLALRLRRRRASK